jgi:peptide/nickel transport system permease protein
MSETTTPNESTTIQKRTLDRLEGIFDVLSSNTLVLTGSIMVGLVVLVGLLAPIIAPYDPNAQEFATMAPPSIGHPFGTDSVGRDVFSRVIFGTRIALLIGVLVVTISSVIGVPLGLIAAYRGGWSGSLIMRGIDVLVSIPPLLFAIVVVASFGANIYVAIAAIGITYIPLVTRVIRGAGISVAEEEYIIAAETMGYSESRVMFKHMLPNIIAPFIVQSTVNIAFAIIDAAALSFLGLGVQPPQASWGAMIASGKGYLLFAWWIAIFPGIFLAMTVLGFNLLGIGLRDVLDPRTGGEL